LYPQTSQKHHRNNLSSPCGVFPAGVCCVRNQALAEEPRDGKGQAPPVRFQQYHRKTKTWRKSSKADTAGVILGVRHCSHLFWDQRSFKIRGGNIKLNNPELVPHWVFSKLKSKQFYSQASTIFCLTLQ